MKKHAFVNQWWDEKAFTLFEILIVIIIIGILAAIMVPRFLGAQDRARVGVARACVDQFRQALGAYEIDYQDFPTTDYNNVAAFVEALVDPDGKAYMILPDGSSFASFRYEYDNSVSPSSYQITVTALDLAGTTVIGSPQEVYSP